MVKVVPICLYVPKNPKEFATNPYDVIPEEELKQMRKNPDSFIHVILPEGDGKEKYENAKKALERMKRECMEKRKDSFYLYKQSNEIWSQRGIIGGFSLKDYEKGKIKIHEKTREIPLKDRIKHIEKTEAQTGLVWLTAKSNSGLKRIQDMTEETEPILDFEKYGWKNQLWEVPKEMEEELVGIFDTIDIYVADGHHRIEAAYRNMKNREGDGPWNYLMAYVANDDEVRVLPYNRVVKKIHIPFEQMMNKIKDNFDVTTGEKPEKHKICMFKGEWYKLVPKEIPDDPVKSLDAAILQENILGPVLGIEDPRKNPNIFFVGGRQKWEKYGKENDLVFSLYPTSVTEVEAVADAGRDMPPKSTWFDPKLLSGLVVYLFY